MILSIVLIVVSCVLFVYWRNKRYNDLINKIPGPPTLPIIGNLLMFNETPEKLYDFMRNVNKQYYPILRFWLGPFPLVSISHADDVEVVLSSTKHTEKGYGYRCLGLWLKAGLLTGHGSKWQSHRKILTPAFHFNILKKYLDVIDDNAKRFIDTLKKEDNETVKDLMPTFTNYTLKVICESTLGVALDKINPKDARDYQNAISTMCSIVLYRTFRPFIQDWMIKPIFEIGRLHRDALATLQKFTDKVLFDRVEYHKSTNNIYLNEFDDGADGKESEESSMVLGVRKKLAMLDLLIKAEMNGSIDTEGIKEELDTFTFAGHDTTAVALVFSISLLAEHTEIQEKARAEVTEILNRTKGEIGTSELQEFNYLERCIKESLRLYPSVPIISRTIREDLTLRGYVIPAGTDIAVQFVDLHRDPNFWPEPEKFDPDRFLPERSQGRHKYSYLPFSAGPRNCIGQKFAMMEMKCTLARILYEFKLESIEKISEVKPELQLINRPSAPVRVKFVRINRP